jgi:PEP-CTERM motif
MSMVKGLLSVAVIALALIWAPVGAYADPAVLHIGTGFGTPCAQGCGGHPNLIDDTFSIFYNGQGQPALSDPLILIIGAPDFGSGTTAPTLTNVTFYDENAGGSSAVTFALLGMGLNGGDGVMTAGQLAYDEAKFNSTTNNSNSFTNWSPLVPGVTEFDLYAFQLNRSIDGGDLLDVTGNFSVGSLVIAYGCDGAAGDALNGSCNGGNGNTYSTPFTEAGHAVPEPIPEPGTLVLLGSGLSGVSMGARRKFGK